MLRITLLSEYEGTVGHRLGYENVAPMDHGAFSEELTNNFRGARVAGGATPRTWPMSWNEDERSVLVPEEVAAHYYGDPRAGSDPIAERDRLIPSFNNERDRVANAWGGYMISPLHQYPAVVRIKVPNMPNVRIEQVTPGGKPIAGAPVFEPKKFWRFEELLAEDADVQLRELEARKGKKAVLSLETMDEATLDQLAALLDKRKKLATAGSK